MDEKATIRGYTRRLLLERGHEEHAVEAFLESPIWEEFYYWVGVGYVEASEAEFRQEIGVSLEERFLTWRERSKRAISQSSSSPVVSGFGGSSAWKTVLVPIPLNWLPKLQQREVEHYLHYLRNRLRTEVDRFLNKIALVVSRDADISNLLQEAATSPCVKTYPYTQNRSQQTESESTNGAVLQYAKSLGYEFMDKAPEAEFLVRVAHLYPCCFSETYAQSGILTEIRGFIHQAPSLMGAEGCSGAVYLLDKAACGRCIACKVMVELTDLFQAVWRALRFWTFAEVFDIVLHDAPLPARVGYALFRSPFTIKHFSTIQNLQFQKGKLMRLIPELELPYSGEWELKLLPCLAAKSVAAIYTRLAPRLEARLWALRLHASEAILDAAFREGEQTRIAEPKWNARLRPGAIDNLLGKWNDLAPSEWHYTTSSMREDFRRALLRARRVIDG